MACSGCGQASETLALDGHYGRQLEIEACNSCGGLWLDGPESHQLTAGATLTLFRRFAESGHEQHAPLQDRKPCPRCGLRLVATLDRQRTTSFEVFACPRGHGRFMTPLAFLRAKNFVRDLDPKEVIELRKHVQQVACTGCGAAVDVRTSAACQHCGAAVAILDPEQVAKTAALLAAQERDASQVDSAWPMHAAGERLRTERLFAAMNCHTSGGQSADLVALAWGALRPLLGMRQR